MGIRHIMTHGEKSAAYMADGYARAALQAQASAWRNSGRFQLAAGLSDAYLACSPVIALSAGRHHPAVSPRLPGTRGFFAVRSVTKLNVHLDTLARFPDLLRQMFREATTGSPGPVHLRLPGSPGRASRPRPILPLAEPQFARIPAFHAGAGYRPRPGRRCEVLAAMPPSRPVIVAGGGVAWPGAQAELVELAEKLQHSGGDLAHRQGTVPEDLPLGRCRRHLFAELRQRGGFAIRLVFYIGSHSGGQLTAQLGIPEPGKRDDPSRHRSG